MVEVLSSYKVLLNGSPSTIQEAITKLKNNEFPNSLSIFHQNYGRLDMERFGDVYYTSRSGPPLPGSGVSRTYGDRVLQPEYILNYIIITFYNLEKTMAIKNMADQKLTKLQVEGANKLLASLQNTSNKPLNRGVRNRIAQMIGEKKPVSGSYSVANNMSRVNNTLFRRKSRKMNRSKQRKTRRSNK